MNRRLELALEEIAPADWLAFEQLAAVFLASEYPTYRTTASASGDKGRDGFLYAPDGDATVAVQMSVTKDWRTKIITTVQTLAANFPNTTQLIYLTNQRIGAAGDKVVLSCRTDFNIRVDIRDISWFVERSNSSPERAGAADQIAAQFVDPLLRKKGLGESMPISIDRDEAEIALLHLSLADIDEAGGKGLTKQCFEALVTSALHDSSPENARSLDEILSEVEEVLPGGDVPRIRMDAQNALARLSKRGGPIKKQGKTGAFYLSMERRGEIEDNVAAFLADEHILENELIAALARTGVDMSKISDQPAALAKALRNAMDSLLYTKGERFATSVISGNIRRTDIGPSTVKWIASPEYPGVDTPHVHAALLAVLSTPSESIHRHIQQISDAYTLFAFLRQTPDVQKTVVKIFSDGELWLDTNIIIPMLCETLEQDEQLKPYTVTIRAASAAGLRLFVTDGVIEEVAGHINRSRTCAYSGSVWYGQIPGLFGRYMSAGMKRDNFSAWVENFCGRSRPLDDIREYLEDEYSIRLRNLSDEADKADTALRGAVQEFWHDVHEKRSKVFKRDRDITLRLIRHDLEHVVGISQLRRRGPSAALGYRHWWLTDDRAAARLGADLRNRLGGDAPRSPAVDPTFLSQLIRVGPLRAAIDKNLKTKLPVVIDYGRMNVTPPELIEEATQLRAQSVDVNDRVLKRRIRDKLDSMRAYSIPARLKSSYDHAMGQDAARDEDDIDALLGDPEL